MPSYDGQITLTDLRNKLMVLLPHNPAGTSEVEKIVQALLDQARKEERSKIYISPFSSRLNDDAFQAGYNECKASVYEQLDRLDVDEGDAKEKA